MWLPLTVLAAALALQGCSRSDTEALAEARAQIDRRDPAAAIVTLKDVLQRHERLAAARLLFAQALLDAGDAEAAVIEFERALAFGSGRDDVLPPLARALLASGQASTLVERHAEQALTQPRAMADFQTTLAKAYTVLGRGPQAEAALSAALAADPGFAAARVLRAMAHAQAGRVDEGLAQLQQVLDARPRDAEALLMRAEILRLGRRDAAAATAAYEQALAVAPTLVPAHDELMRAALGASDLALARRRLAAMQRALPRHPQTVFHEARVALLAGDLGTAREASQRLLKLGPDAPRFLETAGETEARTGDVQAAERHLAKALGLAPASERTRILLARLQVRIGEPARALATLDPLLAVPAPAAEVLATAAEAQLAAGEFRRADGLWARAAAVAPQDPRYRVAVALGQVARGDPAQVRRAFDALERLSADDRGTVADLALLGARLRVRDRDGALRALAAAERKDPVNPLLPTIRGRLALQQGDRGLARTGFERALALDAAFLPAVTALAALDLQDGQPQAAVARARGAVAAAPERAAPRLALAEMQRRAGATPAAVRATLDEAVARAATDPAPRLALVRHHLAQRDPQAALETAQQAAAACPNDADVLAALAQAQRAVGLGAQAVATLKQLTVLRPADPAARVGLARAQLRAGDLAAARRSVQAALDLAPDDLPALGALAEVAFGEQRMDEVLAIARRVQVLAPQRPEGFLWEGSALARQRRWDPALAAFRTAQQRGGGSDAARQRVAALRDAGRPAEAEQAAADWLSSHPDDLAFARHVGEVAAMRGDFAAAERHFRALVARAPDDPGALNNLAYARARLKQPGAAALAERACSLAPDRADLMDTWAMALAAEHQPQRALEVQRRAVQLAPALPLLRLNLARIAIDAGERGLARDELQRLADLGPRFARQAEVAQLLASIR